MYLSPLFEFCRV